MKVHSTGDQLVARAANFEVCKAAFEKALFIWSTEHLGRADYFEIKGIEAGNRMSDTRFDGKHIYEYGKASLAVYDIRGRYIHKANSASQAVFEIRGDDIHRANNASRREYNIRGNLIHTHLSAGQALYEIR